MTTNQSTPVILSDEALEEISTRLPILNTFTGGDVIPLDKGERDALCQTVRALRAERLRLLNLVRYCRHELLDKNLITQEEFALLLEEGSAAHLETYDQMRTQIAAADALHLETANARIEADKENTALREQLAQQLEALTSCDSVLSYIYHRERSRLLPATRDQLFETMRKVERFTRKQP